MPALLRLLLAFLVLAPPVSAQDMRFFSIGSGNIDGGYYEAARAICRSVNRPGGSIRCSAEPTAGSLYNIAALRAGQIDFALVQSDWHRIAYEGTDIFADEGPMTELRSVMSLYPEAVTVLTRRGAGIKVPLDLLGKRIDIGHPTSGRHATVRRVLAELSDSDDDFAYVSQLPDASAIAELCAGNIDAVVLIVGHPNAAVERTLRNCDVFLLPFTGNAIDAVFNASTDYVRTAIQRGIYPDLNYSVPSYAVTATLVTRDDIDPALVKEVVGSTLASLDMLKASTPIFSRVDLNGMNSRGLTAPLHPAAGAAFGAFVVREDTPTQ